MKKTIIFGFLVLILIFTSGKFSSKKQIIFGILIGIISIIIGYFGSNYLNTIFNFS